jgi:lysophospholipase L1-like esterase
MKSTLVLIASCFISFIGVGQSNPWQAEFDKFDQLDSISPPKESGAILFTGSSSIRFWQDPQDDLNNELILNRGFGGSQIQDLIDNFDRIIVRYQPATVVVYSGDNDIAAGKSAEQVYGDFCQLFGMVKAALPQTEVGYIAIKPSIARWGLALEMQKANNLINQYVEGRNDAWFVDVYSIMIGTDGKPKEVLFIEDGLHMSPQGYALWTDALKPYLKD